MKIDTILKQIRPSIKSLRPYPAKLNRVTLAKRLKIKPDDLLLLNTAENLQTDELYLEAITLMLAEYPDPYCTELRTQLAEYTGYESDWLTCGNGSDELIDLLIGLFTESGQEIIIAKPTFPMYEFLAKVRGVSIVNVPRDKNFAVDVAAIERAITMQTRLIFIDSPGNPTGVVTSNTDVSALLKLGVPVVVDEAYFEFCGQTAIELVKDNPNLIVLRTMSKWAGLAGLRIGYMIANPKIIELINSMKQPYNVNSYAQVLGVYALKNRDKFLQTISVIKQLKLRLANGLRESEPVTVSMGEGVFVALSYKGLSGIELADKLSKSGVIVKAITQPGMDQFIVVNPVSEIAITKLIKTIKSIKKGIS